jgi:Stress responsive A/B Barrel Domain
MTSTAFAMYSVTRLLDVSDADRRHVLTSVRAAAEATRARHRLVEPTLPGSRNGGDILVHLRFDSISQWLSDAGAFDASLEGPSITLVNGATYPGVPARNGSGVGAVYRALLLRVLPDTDAATVAHFEDELSSMPRYIPTIRTWQLSRVDTAIGTAQWTHVFEQEFSEVDGLMGPYLMHPIHWAVVDRWFDPECPDVIIRDRVCHSFCAMPHPVLS